MADHSIRTRDRSVAVIAASTVPNSLEDSSPLRSIPPQYQSDTPEIVNHASSDSEERIHRSDGIHLAIPSNSCSEDRVGAKGSIPFFIDPRSIFFERHVDLKALYFPAITQEIMLSFPERYTFSQMLSISSGGVVVSAWDHMEADYKAIKCVFNINASVDNFWDASRELNILSVFKRKSNFVTLRDYYFSHAPHGQLVNMYIVMDQMETNLHYALRLERFNRQRRTQIMREIFMALSLVHVSGLVHRDLKSHNILLDQKGKVVLSDFGSTRHVEFLRNKDKFTCEMFAIGGIVAPEIHFSGTYGAEIDMWAAGCVLAEMILRYHPFPQNTKLGDSFTQKKVFIEAVFDLVGRPTDDVLESLFGSDIFLVVGRGFPTRPSWEMRFPDCDSDELDFLKRLIALNPAKRLSSHDALKHSYFQNIEKSETDEVILYNDLIHRCFYLFEQLPDIVEEMSDGWRTCCKARMTKMRRYLDQNRDFHYPLGIEMPTIPPARSDFEIDFASYIKKIDDNKKRMAAIHQKHSLRMEKGVNHRRAGSKGKQDGKLMELSNNGFFVTPTETKKKSSGVSWCICS